MPELLFKLRNVPDDEAEEVRTLLTEHHIDFYETSAGNWGVSMPALWLKTESQLAQAQQLLQTYQQERVKRVRAEYQQLKQVGKQRTLWDELKENPLRFIIYIGISIILIYLPIKLFLALLETHS
jgi:type III secretory pathway lipoprotein EscJ